MSISDTIIYGSLKDLETRLQQESKLDFVDEYGFTPLIQTAIINDLNKGELLLDHGADVNMRDLTGGSALHWTVENNNIIFSRMLLQQGADSNAYTLGGEPVLVKPILRQQNNCRKLLVDAGSNIDFAYDYINTKLLGHRFELYGYVDIVDHRGYFVEIDLEGFILEFTIGIILRSLQDYRENFSARHLKKYFDLVGRLIDSFKVSARLIQFQHYQTDIEANTAIIHANLKHEPLIIPIAYEGHAISFVKMGNLLAKCDRSHNDLFVDNIVIYQVTRPSILTPDFLTNLMYRPKTKYFIDVELPQILGLKPVKKLVIGSQISGNCSWANIESCVPVIWSLLFQGNELEDTREALAFYYQWLEWDKERALQFSLQGFSDLSPTRQASRAALLAAVLFQRCSAQVPTDIERAKKIIPILKKPGLDYILKSYIEVYCHRNHTPAGENLQKILRLSESFF